MWGKLNAFPSPPRSSSSSSTASVGTSWLDFKRLCRLKKSKERRSRIAAAPLLCCAVQQRSLNPPKTRSGKQVRQNNPPSSSSYIISKSNIYLFPPLLAAACQKRQNEGVKIVPVNKTKKSACRTLPRKSISRIKSVASTFFLSRVSSLPPS